MHKVMLFEGDFYDLEKQINAFLDSEEVSLDDIKYNVNTSENYGRREVTHYAMVVYKVIGF